MTSEGQLNVLTKLPGTKPVLVNRGSVILIDVEPAVTTSLVPHQSVQRHVPKAMVAREPAVSQSLCLVELIQRRVSDASHGVGEHLGFRGDAKARCGHWGSVNNDLKDSCLWLWLHSVVLK